MINLRLLAIILIICPCFSGCAGSRAPKPPIVLPFAVEQAGNKVETEVRIVEERSYTLFLSFHHEEDDHKERARIRKLIGSAKKNKEGRSVETGVPVHLRVKVSAIESEGERVIVDTVLTEHALESWGSNRLDKAIMKLPLRRGRYRVSAEALENVPELKGTRTSFAIFRTYTGK